MNRILIIEDDQTQRSMYQTLLRNHGYDVFAEEDGAEGLKTALDTHPDIILLDIRLPTMDGMEVMRLLRADAWGKTAKIIILSAFDTDNKILEGIAKDDPSYYLMKSEYNPEGVLEKIKTVLTPVQQAQ